MTSSAQPPTSVFPLPDPTRSTSRCDLRARFHETDLMGIVHHAAYLGYFEVGRVEWLRARGVTYSEWAARGFHLAVVEANVRYRASLRFDDTVVVETTLAELRAVSLKYAYVLRRGDTVIADGFTRLGCVDAAHKLLRIPDDIRAVLEAGEA